MHPLIFAQFCDLLNALEAEAWQLPTPHDARVLALVERFDALLDTLVDLDWPAHGTAPANTYEGRDAR